MYLLYGKDKGLAAYISHCLRLTVNCADACRCPPVLIIASPHQPKEKATNRDSLASWSPGLPRMEG